MASKMSVKRNSNKATHMRTLWSSCLTIHWSFFYGTFMLNDTVKKVVLGIVAPGLLKGLQIAILSWEFQINRSWYKQPI